MREEIKELDEKVHAALETLSVMSSPGFWKAIAQIEKGETKRFRNVIEMKKHFGV